MRPTDLLPKLALAATVTAASLGLAETALRFTAPPLSLILKPGMVREFHPSPVHLPGVDGASRFEVNSMGFRAGPIPQTATVRVVALGGSTTECIFLDTSEAWPAVLQARLSDGSGVAWVGNAGISGTRVRHHVVQAETVVHSVPELDAVIVMAGANDFLYYLRNGGETLSWIDDPREHVRVHYESFAVPRRPTVGSRWERLDLTRSVRMAKREHGGRRTLASA